MLKIQKRKTDAYETCLLKSLQKESHIHPVDNCSNSCLLFCKALVLQKQIWYQCILNGLWKKIKGRVSFITWLQTLLSGCTLRSLEMTYKLGENS